jgi:hypothetical protein
MVTEIFLKLTDYPVFRRIIWRRVYELLATKFKVKDWSFMNYAYAPSDNEAPLKLEQHDEINRYQYSFTIISVQKSTLRT